eukprot:14425966-Heterocapsa_arctica.AAC.1
MHCQLFGGGTANFRHEYYPQEKRGAFAFLEPCDAFGQRDHGGRGIYEHNKEDENRRNASGSDGNRGDDYGGAGRGNERLCCSSETACGDYDHGRRADQGEAT